MKPVLLLVNGMPGTGKTTLSKKLTKDLGVPLIGKDDIKEFLFEKLGVGDVSWSQDLGAASAEALSTLIERFAEHERSLIAESAFINSFAAPRISSLLKRTNINLVEVYCTTDPAVRSQRSEARITDGTRHPGHADHLRPKVSIGDKYAPLKVGNFVGVDTTEFADKDYDLLLENVRRIISSNEGVNHDKSS